MIPIRKWNEVQIGDLIYCDHGGSPIIISECFYKDNEIIKCAYIATSSVSLRYYKKQEWFVRLYWETDEYFFVNPKDLILYSYFKNLLPRYFELLNNNF
jgi:hypothetical protein